MRGRVLAGGGSFIGTLAVGRCLSCRQQVGRKRPRAELNEQLIRFPKMKDAFCGERDTSAAREGCREIGSGGGCTRNGDEVEGIEFLECVYRKVFLY